MNPETNNKEPRLSRPERLSVAFMLMASANTGGAVTKFGEGAQDFAIENNSDGLVSYAIAATFTVVAVATMARALKYAREADDLRGVQQQEVVYQVRVD